MSPGWSSSAPSSLRMGWQPIAVITYCAEHRAGLAEAGMVMPRSGEG